MKLVGRIPVESLGDERLTNIERRIVAGAADAAARGEARASRLSPMLAVAVVAIAVMGAGVVGWKLRGEPASVAAQEPPPLAMQGDGQHARLDIGDAVIEADPATAYTVTRPSGGVLVALTRGKVELAVGKRGERAPLVVRAGDTEVVVVGTRFSVDYGDGTGEVDVRVTEGVVRVVHQQREVRVAAGQAWTGARGVIALADAPARPGPAIAAAESRGSGDVEIDPGAEPRVLHDRVAAVPGARAAGDGPAAPRPRQPGAGEAPSRRTLDRPGDPYTDLKTAIRSQPVLPALATPGDNPASAVSEYRNIVIKETGDRASLAFYSIAVVQHLKLGRDADALSTLDGYLRRFAGGSEYAAALWLRVRISCLRAIDDRCRQAAYTYLRSTSEGPAAAIAERLTLSP